MSDPETPHEAAARAARPKRLPKAETTSPQAASTPPSEPAAAREEDGFVTLAAVAGAHGVQGEVRLKLFTDTVESLRDYGTFEANGRTLTLKSVRPGPNGAVARFDGVSDRTAAETLRGTPLRVPRSALPPLGEGEYYHADLIGCLCISDTGEPLGAVAAVENFGAGDVVEIRRPDGKLFMVPITAIAAVPATPLVVDTAFIAV